MNNNKKYIEIHKKYLAESLSFLGFRYMKFKNENNEIVYTFENNEEFIFAFESLKQLKNQLRNKKI